MASGLIYAIKSSNEGPPPVDRPKEAATQTFKNGVPVQLVAGFAQEWDGITVALGIHGVSKDYGSNLTVAGTAQTLTFGQVPNQALAVNIPRGAPLNDGKITVETASQLSTFTGQVGPAQTPVLADIGKTFGMTKDTDGHWFVDRTKVGATAVVTITELDQFDTARGVHFVFLASASQ